MTGKQLKNSILQWAIQGKLVPQDPNDEPASVLLEKIREEKARLVKEGKIKKDKNESIIFRGDDNSHYEKFLATGEVKCIDNEIPFEIPDGWEWCRMGSIIELLSGQDFTPEKYNSNNRGIPYITGASNIGCGKLIINRWTEYPSVIGRVGDLLIVCKGSGIGKMCFCDVQKIHIARQIQIVRAFSPLICSQYLKSVIEANLSIIIANAQGVIPGISREHILSLIIPIPPFGTQQRIVEKLKLIQPLIQLFDITQNELDYLDTSIKENLKKSILQEAIQGRLVPQNPDDEPASMLLERIRDEKQKLLKEGKLKKKDITDSVIFRGDDNSHYEKVGDSITCIDDEIPFDIPNNWVWCRLKEIVYNHGQITPQDTFSYIDIGSIDNKRLCLNEKENILVANKAPSRARRVVKQGDILYSTVRPYLHNICIVDKQFSATPIASTGLAVIACYSGVSNEYLFRYLQSPQFAQYANDGDNAKGVAYPVINDEKLYSALIPIPPVVEQLRIVQRINELYMRLK